MRNLILVITLIMSIMLFTSNPLDNTARLYQAIWNTGHLFFFALFTWLLITQTPIYKLSGVKMLLLVVLSGTLLGGAIEVVQFSIGRYMQWQDVLTDVLGAILGFFAAQFALPHERRFMARIVILAVALCVLLAAFYPVINVIRDNAKMQADMPLIANFESSAELSRWETQDVEMFVLDQQLQVEGESSVLLKYSMGQYPAVSLVALFPDWSAFNFLHLNIYNDQIESLVLNLKIYDHLHRERGSEFNDRFNTKITLKKGWNNVKINLLEVYHSPNDRQMDLGNIAGLSLFLHNPDNKTTIHLDNIYLSK